MLNRQSQHPKSARHAALLRRLGDTIRAYRQEKGLSLETLKELTNLSPSYLAQIERGERNATVLSLIRIADALNISYTDLLEPLNAFRPSPPQADQPANQSL